MSPVAETGKCLDQETIFRRRVSYFNEARGRLSGYDAAALAGSSVDPEEHRA